MVWQHKTIVFLVNTTTSNQHYQLVYDILNTAKSYNVTKHWCVLSVVKIEVLESKGEAENQNSF